MAQLTDEQAQKYLKNNGFCCPFCEYEFIQGHDHDYESNEITQRMTCPECDAVWHDAYILDGVYDEECDHRFALRTPRLRINVEDQGSLDGYSRLYIMLYPPNSSDASACLREAEFTDEEMTPEQFDEFIEFAKQAAVTWDAALILEVTKEDYFSEQ